MGMSATHSNSQSMSTSQSNVIEGNTFSNYMYLKTLLYPNTFTHNFKNACQ